MTIEELCNKAIETHGVILSSNDCNEVEISMAKSCGRWATIGSLGFVLRPEWVTKLREADENLVLCMIENENLCKQLAEK